MSEHKNPSISKENRIGKLIGKGLVHFFVTLSSLSKKSPMGNLERWGVEAQFDIPYDSEIPERMLDIYRPINSKDKKLPVVMYVHGGAFCAMSKDTHWVMARNFARAGYIVVNINYRLAPKNPYPAGLQDVCKAWKWLYENIESIGGDSERVVVAGESAGANLTLSLALACILPRKEIFAKEIYELKFIPKAIIPMCGIFEVRNPDRFLKPSQNPLRFLVFRNVLDIQQKYVQHEITDHLDFVDPLLMIEELEEFFPLSLPPTFLSVGTWDPLVEDSKRLYEALTKRKQIVEVRYYHREIHAFQALLFRKQARIFWKEMFCFLEDQLKNQSVEATSIDN